jgi:hypothetical protein
MIGTQNIGGAQCRDAKGAGSGSRREPIIMRVNTLMADLRSGGFPSVAMYSLINWLHSSLFSLMRLILQDKANKQSSPCRDLPPDYSSTSASLSPSSPLHPLRGQSPSPASEPPLRPHSSSPPTSPRNASTSTMAQNFAAPRLSRVVTRSSSRSRLQSVNNFLRILSMDLSVRIPSPCVFMLQARGIG